MKTVFIADNDKRLERGMSRLFQKSGFSTIGVEKLSGLDRTIDVAVLNLEIPSAMKEWLMVSLTRFMGKNSVLVLTTSADTPYMTDCKGILLLKKPFSFNELVQKLNNNNDTNAPESEREACHE